MKFTQNLITRAEQVIPGGVNSPVRAFGAVGGDPIFIERGEGPYIYNTEGKQYIDYVGSWGALVLGHCDPDVVAAVQTAAALGLSFGAPTVNEIELAEKIISLVPSIEKVRLVNSGTEATMSALRLARGYTKKDKIIKFIGCYHGHSDSLLVKAGSGLLTFANQNNTASSAGVPESVVQDTLLADFNDLDSVKKLYIAHKDNIAAVIIEPVPGNMNLILPELEFLQGLRDLCTENNSILIFDEVMSGFRVALGGAQALYNISPDLTTLGKVIGGGLPVGAFGGKREIMNCLSPIGSVYQAGTLSGNPLATAAGLANLNKISQPGFYEKLSKSTAYLVNNLKEVMTAHNIPFVGHYLGSMFGLFFVHKNHKINNFNAATQCNNEFFKKFFHAMLNHGVYLAPSAFEAGFVSSAHDNKIIEATIEAADRALKSIK
ncbi:MAG: glutamate-1-semialdehyde 2,1-aminomutase [Gammaproteobacteria bacterium]|nr:glutamate-1-semialdehyde 2,1-aminomutase [Gammaproteobacteria bacterium]